ncbi:hypothetical protein J4459_00135 [Candidatus Woesearchaeota archaeon]|nr:hypothetical protein [Candidatus Woesearchaeota archaeon]
MEYGIDLGYVVNVDENELPKKDYETFLSNSARMKLPEEDLGILSLLYDLRKKECIEE